MPESKTTLRTSNTPDTIQMVAVKIVKFAQLWAAYPDSSIKHIDTTTHKDVFSDHCAINVSQALLTCDIKLKTFTGTRCWNCPTPDSSTQKGVHAIRAQELSDYLMTRPFPGCPQPVVLSGENFEKNITGKTGIIFFKDYWLRGSEKVPTGDHIDLWNKNELAGSGSISTFLRLTFPDFTETITSFFAGEEGRVTSLFKAKQVLFWEMK